MLISLNVYLRKESSDKKKKRKRKQKPEKNNLIRNKGEKCGEGRHASLHKEEKKGKRNGLATHAFASMNFNFFPRFIAQ